MARLQRVVAGCGMILGRAHCACCVFNSRETPYPRFEALEQFLREAEQLPADYHRPRIDYGALYIPANLYQYSGIYRRYLNNPHASVWCSSFSDGDHACSGCAGCMLCTNYHLRSMDEETIRSTFEAYASELGFTREHPEGPAADARREVATNTAMPADAVVVAPGASVTDPLTPCSPLPVDMPPGNWEERLRRFNTGLACWCEDRPVCASIGLTCEHCVLSVNNPNAERTFAAWAAAQGWKVTRAGVVDGIALPARVSILHVNWTANASDFNDPRSFPALKPGDFVRLDIPIKLDHTGHTTRWLHYIGDSGSSAGHCHRAWAAARRTTSGEYMDVDAMRDTGEDELVQNFSYTIVDGPQTEDIRHWCVSRTHITKVVRHRRGSIFQGNACSFMDRLRANESNNTVLVWRRPY